MRRLGKAAVVVLLVGLSGCRMGRVLDRIAPDTVRDSKGYYEALRQRQADLIVQSFDPSMDKDRLRSQLPAVVALVPQQEPIGVETIGASVDCRASGYCIKEVILEYKYPERWIEFQVKVSNKSGRYLITDLYVEPESEPALSRSGFTLRGKGLVHYLMLLAALVCGGVAVSALVVCIRTPMKRRKWLWIIVTILGVGKLRIEWATGEIWHKTFFLAIFPVGFGINVGSAFLYVSVPFGAIVFLAMRRRLSEPKPESQEIAEKVV